MTEKEPGSRPRMRNISSDQRTWPSGMPSASADRHFPAADVGGRLGAFQHVFAPAQRSLRGPDLADVVGQDHETADLSSRIQVGTVGGANVARPSVSVVDPGLERDLLALERPFDVRAQLLPGRLAQHLADVAPADLLGGVAEPAAVGLIGPHVARAGIQVGQQGRHRVRHEPQSVFVLARLVRRCHAGTFSLYSFPGKRRY